MKTPSFRRARGFTLVELLVVITIIAVLAGAGFAAGNAAIQKAKRATALASAIAIETAVNNFFSEYGSMPVESSSDTTVDTSSDTDLLKVLLGMESGNSPLNTRGVKFLSVKEGKGDKNGLVYNTNGSSIRGLFDPWGGGYHVMLDGDYDEQVKPSPSGGGGATLNGRRVAVWSDGADGVKGGGKPGDDVTTWK